jgi:hypothetical protein
MRYLPRLVIGFAVVWAMMLITPPSADAARARVRTRTTSTRGIQYLGRGYYKRRGTVRRGSGIEYFVGNRYRAQGRPFN